MKNGKNTKGPGKNMQTIILSLIIAVGVWVLVNYVNDPDTKTTLSGLNVHFTGESALREKGLVITGKSNIPSSSVVISGKRRDLISNMDKITIDVDVSDITETGEYSRKGSVSLPTTRISVEKEKYGTIPFTVEKLCEKEIPIKLKQSGTIKDKLVKSETQQKTVKLTGSQAELDTVSYGIVDIDLTSLPPDGTAQLKYLLLNQSGSYIEKNETIEAYTSEITVKNTVYSKKTLPVKLKLADSIANDYRLDEEKSTLSETSAEVGVLGYNTDEAVYVYIDRPSDDAEEYSMIETDGMYIPPSHDKIKVKAALSPIVTKEIEIYPSAENAADNVEAHVDSIWVHIKGAEDKINPDNIKAHVDLSGIAEGTHSLPVSFSGEDISIEGEYRTNVTVTKK